MAQRRPKEAPGYFRMSIHDVLDFDEWQSGFDTDVTLASISQKHLDVILKNRRVRGMRSGEVVFFVSMDKQRARVLLCLSREPKVYSVGTVAFGKHSPELVMSLWLGDRLRSIGLESLADRVDEMSAEERLAEWHRLRKRADEILEPQAPKPKKKKAKAKKQEAPVAPATPETPPVAS